MAPTCDDRRGMMFRFLLKLPAVLVTTVPTWSVGDVITVGCGEQLRVVAIDDFPHAELFEHDVRAIFTVERVWRVTQTVAGVSA